MAIFEWFASGEQDGQQSANETFRQLVEFAPNAIVMIDQHGKIELINTQTERIFGYLRDQLIGQPVEMLIPERFRTHHPQHRSHFFSSPSTRSMGSGRDLFGLRRDGSRRFKHEVQL